jgi:hypothetical protein
MKKFVVPYAIGMLVMVGPASAQQLPAAQPPAATQQPSAASSASMKPTKPYRVVDLKRGSFVIDTPGNWVLNRSWTFEDVSNALPLNIIDVVADGVVLDFRGFEIEVTGTPDTPPVTVINVQGNAFLLKGATVSICCGEGGSVLRSTGNGTEIDGLRGFSYNVMTLEGSDAIIRNSAFHARNGVHLSSRGTIENTVVSCRSGCVIVDGDENKLLNSRILPGQFNGVTVGGDGNVIAGNLIDFPAMGPEIGNGFDIRGNANVVRDNTLATGGETYVVVNVSGIGNVIDGNIGAVVGPPPGVIHTGVRFEQNGNFYGDNRMDATVPFDLGATTQTDWGGNVGY